MDLIKASIERPIAVAAAVILIVLFGLVALTRIPVQLAPDVRQPVLNISTNWGGGAPAEVEREIVIRQENALQGLEGVTKTTASADNGRGRITLEFTAGADLDRAIMLTANRLDRVDGYPDEADEPRIDTSGTEDNAIAWFILTQVDGVDRPIHEFGDFVNDVVKDRIERVRGVSRVNVFGDSARELRVVIDPQRLARYQLTVPEVARILRAESASISAGDVEEGKRRYAARIEGALDAAPTIEQVVLRQRTDPVTGAVSRVTVADVARVEFAYEDPRARIRQLGEPALALNAVRESGANVIETMAGVRAAVDALNAGPLQARGLALRQVYDETVYIESSIALVQQNIWVGGLLAAAILLLFLRSPRATLIIAVAIPVSVIGAFVAMAGLGRSLNVISLAGIAFSVGMVVDAAIVVLENIYKRRERGDDPKTAAYKGARQVWGAILVSALTTVMVFIPILIRDLEISQLFRDIAVAISVSVLLSLLVSVTLLPALAARVFKAGPTQLGRPLRLPVVDDAAAAFARTAATATALLVRRKALGGGVVLGVAALAAVATATLSPQLDYLPSGERNLIIGRVIPPPGYNLATVEASAKRLEDAVRPYWATPAPDGAPTMERFFFVALRNIAIVGAIAAEPSRIGELKPILTGPVFSEPGTFGIMSQPSIFGRSLSGSRSISLDISGPDLEALLPVAQRAFALMSAALPRSEGNQYRPRPGLSLGQPEVRLTPDRVRLADVGVSVGDFGRTIDAFNDGLRVDEITVDGERIDLRLTGEGGGVERTQDVASLPIVTARGDILPAGLVADIAVTSGPTAIRRIDGARTITIQVTPADAYPIEAAVARIQAEVVEPMRAQGLPPGVTMRFSGAVDKLETAWTAMVWDLALALVIVYLVIAVLFESFAYPLVVLVTVPLAAVGGIIGLGTLNLFVDQKLDMLTLLGFVILVGIVVNNAILLVDQSLAHTREGGLAPDDAIRTAAADRLRPIFMSTLTSLFGMAPLVLFPGAGAELYRGLGSVVVGGLALSALLTLLATPPLTSIVATAVERRRPTSPRAAQPVAWSKLRGR